MKGIVRHCFLSIWLLVLLRHETSSLLKVSLSWENRLTDVRKMLSERRLRALFRDVLGRGHGQNLRGVHDGAHGGVHDGVRHGAHDGVRHGAHDGVHGGVRDEYHNGDHDDEGGVHDHIRGGCGGGQDHGGHVRGGDGDIHRNDAKGFAW